MLVVVVVLVGVPSCLSLSLALQRPAWLGSSIRVATA